MLHSVGLLGTPTPACVTPPTTMPQNLPHSCANNHSHTLRILTRTIAPLFKHTRLQADRLGCQPSGVFDSNVVRAEAHR